MNNKLTGIHHVTAIGGQPQSIVDFYCKILGLRLVKRSVNQDDPATYHLFFADAEGLPGTDLTFFAWPNGRREKKGHAQTSTVGFAVPPHSLSYWMERLSDNGIVFQLPFKRFDEEVLRFQDTDGLTLELVATADALNKQWTYWYGGGIPEENAIRGLHSVSLLYNALVPTASYLVNNLGFLFFGKDHNIYRYTTNNGGTGTWCDIVVDDTAERSRFGVGTIHHVAWRTPNEKEHIDWWNYLRDSAVAVSDRIDRFWFHSIYFHEPGGILFEIATDGPGFGVDEPTAELGTKLVLPPWLEPYRSSIENKLLPIHLPYESEPEYKE